VPQDRRKTPGIHLLTDTGPEVEIVLVDQNGTEHALPKRTPAEDLIHAMDRDYTEYRKRVQALWDEHPLFEERLEVPAADLDDFVAEALLIPSMLKDIDPVAFFRIGMRIDAILQTEDDGTAEYLLNTGAAILRVLREPVHAQIRLRNIFEIAFDDYERGTQRERFEALERVWLGTVDRPFLCRKVPEKNGEVLFNSRMDYTPSSLFELYQLELSLYFGQEKQRIVRCEHCWNYFIPKTKQQTLYCDRVFDGISCKKAGANLMRRLVPEQDEALAIYNRLRERMAERLERYEDAPPQDKSKLFPMDAAKYANWLDQAQKARAEYRDGLISAEEFLRRIDIYGDLESYSVEKQEPLSPRDTLWRKNVQRNIDFDPQRRYPPMAYLEFGKDPNPQWELRSTEDQIKTARGGLESLMEKYKKEN